MISIHNNKASLHYPEATTHSGFMLVEALIGIAIGAVFIVTLLSLVIRSSAIASTGQARLSGELYAKEAVEALRDLEQSNSTAIFSGTCMSPSTCHPENLTNAWQLITGNETLPGGYSRILYFEEVYRDISIASRPIVASGTPSATLDTQTKKAIVRTTWQDRGGVRNSEYEIYVYQF